MRFKILILAILGSIISVIGVQAQLVRPNYPDSIFSTYYWQRYSHFKTLDASSGDVVFLGNSITDGAEWAELFNDLKVKNRGISGDVSAGIIHRLDEITSRQPKKVFLLIGTNDLAKNVTVDSLVKNVSFIARYLKQENPSLKVYVQSILPVNPGFKTFSSHTGNSSKIKEVNIRLKAREEQDKFVFIDLNSSFTDENGYLKKEWTNDGLHLKGDAYLVWKHLIYPYVYDLQPVVSIIPKPQKLVFNDGFYKLGNLQSIVIKSPSLMKEALVLKNILEKAGIQSQIIAAMPKDKPYIELSLTKGEALKANPEGYQLQVTEQKISISAEGATGIYYGLQTLRQLMFDHTMVQACNITDYPAFKWRGYMVDAARNFQSVALLKQQIDRMAAYKLNIFHFHLTEDIAWRLAIQKYPELTDPENMLRDKGSYYTVEQLKELIHYCKERHITLVPEIDMPGHSAAFKKAMHVDMQSDSGMLILKNILKEICAEYDVPYIHIGADEVKITNKDFVPEMSAYLQGLGKQVIGWEPGGNFNSSTIRQLWMDDAIISASAGKIKYIDSKHLYINHMDPLESVVTIFNRQLCNTDQGNDAALGATLCLWPDRAVATESDVMIMNPVYPAMIAFAERSWLGKGYAGWVANMNTNGEASVIAFKDFENRLMDHKKVYFQHFPFPYQRQSDLNWKLYGPYKNGGNLSMKFKPEESGFNPAGVKNNAEARGGTIILKHWWAPQVKAVLSNPEENSTWYAFAEIWSDTDTLKNFWIGFNNLSRSMNTDSPKNGSWDNHHSEIWVNNILIPPPVWLHAGQIGNLEIPLIDEGYEYRKPTLIKLKKGWNQIRIKAPIGSFKGKNWQNPEKWMFTCIGVD